MFQAAWNHFYGYLGIRFDLTPEQMRLQPLCMNLLAAAFGIPAVRGLFARNHAALSSRPVHYVVMASSAGAMLMLLQGTVHWVIMDPGAISTGLGESLGAKGAEGEVAPQIRDGLFKDVKRGISLKLPENWEVQGAKAIQRFHDSGSRAISGDDRTPSDSQLPPEIDIFRAARKYPESHPSYNPSLAFVSYERKAMKAQGIGTLSELVGQWSQLRPPITLIAEPSIEKIGDFEGYRLRMRADFNGVLVQQNVFVFETADHYVSATLSIQNQQDRAVLEAAIKSVAKNK